MTVQSRPEGLVRVWSYLMATTNRTFRYSYPRANLCRSRGASELGNLTVPCHGQPEVKRSFPCVLLAQMQNCISEEVQGISFSGYPTLLRVPDQPCEMRKVWGKKTTSAELCKQQPMVIDCVPALRCTTPLTARLWAEHTRWLKTALLTIIRVTTTIPRRDLTECLTHFFLSSHFSSLQGTIQGRRQLNYKANLAENTRHLLYPHRRQQVLALFSLIDSRFYTLQI